MNELTLIALVVVGMAGLFFATINALMNKDNRIAELEHALVAAYTELELRNLGVMK